MKSFASLFRHRGSSLIAVMLTLVVILSLAGITLDDSLRTYKLSARSSKIASAQSIAEGELESMFYKWRLALLNDRVGQDAVTAFAHTATIVDNRYWDNATPDPLFPARTLVPTTSVPALAIDQSGQDVNKWMVKRSLSYERTDRGRVLGGAPKEGEVSYYTARGTYIRLLQC
jgi:Tfp pilus assembly protein PilX